MPKGYVISRVDGLNPEAYARYAAAATKPIAEHGGKAFARGGRFEALEGKGTRNVVLDESTVANEVGVAPGDYVRLSVSDTGVGMREEDIATAKLPSATAECSLTHVSVIARANQALPVDRLPGAGVFPRFP